MRLKELSTFRNPVDNLRFLISLFHIVPLLVGAEQEKTTNGIKNKCEKTLQKKSSTINKS